MKRTREKDGGTQEGQEGQEGQEDLEKKWKRFPAQ